MSGSSRNLLCVYGEQGRRCHVNHVVSACFGVNASCCTLAPIDGEGPLAAVCFDWPTESAVGLITDLSRRMPNERFELYANPIPPSWGGNERKVFRAGKILDDFGPGDPAWTGKETPVSMVPMLERKMPLPAGSELVGVAKAYLDAIYSHVGLARALGWWCHWTDEVEVSDYHNMIKAIKLVLTPTEVHEIEEYQRQHRDDVEKIELNRV